MTDGPFYPPPAYRAKSLDWDADLTTVRGFDPDGQPLPRARGVHLDLRGAVLDADERKEVELRLQKPAAGEPVAWVAERDLIVPAR